ncbi:MAG: SurA N-terminal domain-containing protein [Bacteroidetes bacterium]|nr:SurA N-terminal domain-containing protein [Bacteroidota bacterium]
MAIIGRIRKHSGLAVIIIGVAIAAFVIGDFGKKRYKGTNDIGSISGEAITSGDFNSKVEQALALQKENAGNEKITEEQTFNIRENTWTTMVRDILMNKQYDELGLVVSPEELFDQVQGKNPHRYILQYFKDPKTGLYDPGMVLNYLKNLDKMEPKAKEQWLRFEKAIKEERIQAKYDNLLAKGYYIPKAFLKKEYIRQTEALKIRDVAPSYQEIPDNDVKLTDADYQHYYNEYKQFFDQPDAARDIEYVTFEVAPSPIDQKRIFEDVQSIYKDFLSTSDVPDYVNANSDKKYDSAYMKKGQLQGKLDSLAFSNPSGSFIPPFQDNMNWYMAKVMNIQDRPDSMKASMILITWEGTKVSESVKRTKEQAKKKADSLLVILKKVPDQFPQAAKVLSEYPTAKDDGGDLKWFADGNANYWLFFKNGLDMKVSEIKIIETPVGYAIFKLTDKTPPVKKVRIAYIQRQIAPSNQTYQDTYIKASAFAGQNRTAEAFDKAAVEKGLQKKSSQSLKEMDNNINGLTNVREVVRWAYAEKTQVGEVSPVFDLGGKYVVVVLKNILPKGTLALEKVKDRLTPAVKNEVKVKLLTDKMAKSFMVTKDVYSLATQFRSKVDTARITFGGYGTSAISREAEILGQLFNMNKGVVHGPLEGRFGAYFVLIDEVIPAPPKQDYSVERNQMMTNFVSRVSSAAFDALKKAASISDNRLKFY